MLIKLRVVNREFERCDELLPKHMVHFFGPDGAGKTTQVRLLMDYYGRKGSKVRKYWVRSPHTFAYFLWRFFVIIGFYRTVLNALCFRVKIPAVQSSKVLRTFWSIAEFFSVLPLIVRAQIYMLKGYTLVAERYLVDTIVTVSYFLDDPYFIRGIISRVLRLLIPKGTAFIFLDTDFETIYQRRAKFYKNIDPEGNRNFFDPRPAENLEPRQFIDFQRKMYAILANSCNALVIDTSQNSIEETFRQIVKYLHIE